MTLRSVGTLEGARRILAHLVLQHATVRVKALVPDGPPTIAVHPPGVLPPQLRVLMARPLVRKHIAQHMELGAARFGQQAPDVHSISGTAAGFAHLQLALLTFDQRELFEERSGVREFDDGLPRTQAELLALFDTLDHSAVIEAVAVLASADAA